MNAALDASALPAYLHDEAGAERVTGNLADKQVLSERIIGEIKIYSMVRPDRKITLTLSLHFNLLAAGGIVWRANTGM